MELVPDVFWEGFPSLTSRVEALNERTLAELSRIREEVKQNEASLKQDLGHLSVSFALFAVQVQKLECIRKHCFTIIGLTYIYAIDNKVNMNCV